MNWSDEAQAGVLFATAGLSVPLAAYVWRRRRTPGAVPLLAICASVATWAGAAGAYLLSETAVPVRLWITLIYAGTLGVTTSWAAFCFQHTGRHVARPGLLAGLGVGVAGLLTLLVATSDFHGWIWRRPPGVERFPGIPGFGYWFLLTYTQVLSLAGLTMIGSELLNRAPAYRRQNAVVFLAGMIPLGVNVAHEFGGWSFGMADPTPCCLLLSVLLLWWGLFRLGVLDLIPVAHSTLVSCLSDAVVVVDARERLLDFNAAAREMFGGIGSDAIGRPASDLFPFWPEIVASASSNGMRSPHVEANQGAATRFLDARRQDLPGPHGESRGHLYVLRDVTEQRQVELEREKLLDHLQAALGQVKTLSGLLPICSACHKVRDKAGGWLDFGKYLARHTDASLTHGLCPECMDRMYPELRRK